MKKHEHDGYTAAFIIFGAIIIMLIVWILIMSYDLIEVQEELDDVPRRVCHSNWTYEIITLNDDINARIYFPSDKARCNDDVCIIWSEKEVCEIR
jgi:hypothetical protein